MLPPVSRYLGSSLENTICVITQGSWRTLETFLDSIDRTYSRSFSSLPENVIDFEENGGVK